MNFLAGPDDDDSDERLRDAYVHTTALAAVQEVRHKVDIEALELTDRLFADYRVAIKALPDDRQQDYEDIRAMATTPQKGALRAPRTRIEGFSIATEDGPICAAPVAPLHLMADPDGYFPLSSLNNWERDIVLTELARPNVRGWYRNPSRAAVDSLGIAYRDETGNWRSMHPDFVFFHEVRGKMVASILDPHGHHLEDALMKLKALANFAATYGDAFHRIEALAEVDGRMKVLDMKIEDVRDAIKVAKQNAVDLYRSESAVDYGHENQGKLSFS